MKRILILLFIGFFSSSILISCATKQEAGALTGALVGATVGSTVGGGRGKALAIWLGAVVGAHIGQTIGKYMDDQDRINTSMVLENNRTFQSSAWRNPDTEYEYTVTPTRTYEEGTGPCREFTVNAQIGGKTEQVYGTACRQADGSWKIIK